ncbi:MAG: Asp23/Gls24 family envelope stress response protein [Lachnospiraceae bacterium]|nr:Asp23/Gls24 family envelope stress response protein [Lachnospiraceae bacterium]
MKKHISSQKGEILFEQDVIAKYAGLSASECFGVVGLASVNMKDGLARLLKNENITQGVTLNADEDGIRLDLHIIVAYGVSISAVADNLMKDVKYRVEDFCGIKVKEVNVYVEGVRVLDEED